MFHYISNEYNEKFPELEARLDRTDATIKSKPIDSGKTNLATFTMFSLLPIELRLIIFNIINNTPRTIEVKLTRIGTFLTNERGIKLPKLGLQYIPGNSVPTLLHVNQEARGEGLKVYKPCFGGGKCGGPRNTIYVHLPLDILLITMPEGSCKIARQEFSGRTFSFRDILSLTYKEGPWTGGLCWDRLYEPDSFKLVILSIAALRRLSHEPDFMTIEGPRRIRTWRLHEERGMDSWEEQCMMWLLEWKSNNRMRDWIRSLTLKSTSNSGV